MNISNFLTHMTDVHKSATEYYEDMDYDIVPGLKGINRSARWMNVGFWRNCNNYNKACENLARLLSEAGGFSSYDKLLDVGCGCGEQDYYWAELYPGISITAMDIVEKQIEEAEKRKPYFDRSSVTFMTGDAGSTGFEAETFTKVSALDCEYHFNTREKFYREAYRVLKKNGVLAVTDMLPDEHENWGHSWQKKWREGIFIPEENMYSYTKCVDILKKTGFRKIRVKRIRNSVFTGLAWYFVFRFLKPDIPIDKLNVKIRKSSFRHRIYPKIWGFLFGTSDYVLITAIK